MRLEERERELSAVSRVLGGAREGTGLGLLIEGAPGIGKTRLLAAARERAEGMTVVAARASELEREFPFAVVRQLLEPVARDALFAGAAELARPVLRGVGAGEQDAGAALHGLYWLAANLAAERPVLVLVDDLHWADPPSLRWLAYLAQRVEGLPIGLIAASRPGEAGEGRAVLDVLAAHPAFEVIEPAGLSDAAVARALGEAAEPAFVTACARVTGGNPFLLGELLRELADVAPTDANASLVARQTPRAVSRAASARLRRLPSEATALAHAVVILGDGADPATAAALAGLDEDAASRAADALEAAAILAGGGEAGVAGRGDAGVAGRGEAVAGGGEAPDGRVSRARQVRSDAAGSLRTTEPVALVGEGGRRLSFAHPLVRESVYAELTAAERARWHRRAAEVLTAAGVDAERVAIHRHACDPAGDAEAVRVLREAAASARRRGATEVAVSHLRRALAEPPDDERAVRRELGAAELQAGRFDAAAEQLRAAVGRDPHVAAELGAALQLAGRPEQAVEVLTQAIAALDETQREIGLLLQATRAAASQGNRAAAERASRAGFRFVAAPGSPRTPGERLFVSGLAYREAMTGSAATARELALHTTELLDDPGPGVPAVYSSPLALFFSGALEEATEGFTRVIEWARRHGSHLSYIQGSHLRSAAWWRRGNLAEAEADAEVAAAHPSFMVRPGALVLVEIALAQDDPETAQRLWRDLKLDADAMAGRASVATRQLRGRLKLATGRPEDGLTDLLACREAEDTWGIGTPTHSTWRSDAVRALAALGRSDEAQQLSTEDVERARAFGEPRALGIALRAAGLTQRTLAPLEEAVRVLERSPAKLEHATSLLELGAALRRAGKRTEARDPLREAIARATACGATAVATRAHDELVAAGARPRRDPIESRSTLTASESRVARMAAEGLTNREIAQALFLTEKTIEVHLTSTYRKLDIGSRSQLPRVLGETPGGVPEVA